MKTIKQVTAEGLTKSEKNFTKESRSNRSSPTRHLILIASLIVLFMLALKLQSNAQVCTPNVPTYSFDFTGHPDSTFNTPSITRAGNCCGTTAPDRCIHFDMILDNNTVAVNFEITSGAIPTGALFYQIDCGTPTPVGQAICITGAGHHDLTFCKPGNNTNTYAVRAISAPTFPNNDTVRIGCSKSFSAKGLIPSTITWNSIYPGTPGDYNNYLSCASGCSTAVFTPQAGSPPYIDYQICGTAEAGCNNSSNVCGTVRIFVAPEVTVTVTPSQAQLNCNTSSVTLTATTITGASLVWSPGGETTSSITVSSGGTYTVTASSNDFGCPSTASASSVIDQDNSTPNLSCAQNIPCIQNNSATLCAFADAGVTFAWSGKGIMGNTEGSCINVINAGTFTVVATKTSSGCTETCSVTISTVNLQVTPTSYLFCNITSAQLCASATNGSTFLWSGPGIVGSNTTACITVNQPGIYTVTATTPDGCSESKNVEVKQLTTNTNCDQHCTRTQGYYGSPGKLCDGRNATKAISDMLITPLVVGDGARTITFNSNDAGCLNSKMPSGSTPSTLPVGNVTCAGATGKNYLKNGKFISVLLGQTIALSLNVRLDPTLGPVEITGMYLTTFAADNCVNGNPIPSTAQVFVIPQSVLTYLDTNNTVNDLLALANRALGGTYLQTIGGPTLSDINAAVDAINKGFDGCRISMGFSSTPPLRMQNATSSESIVAVKAYPNPFSDVTTISYTPSSDCDNVSVEIFNLSGEKVSSIYNGAVNGNEKYQWDFDARDLAHGVYFYRVNAGQEAFHGKLILVKNK